MPDTSNLKSSFAECIPLFIALGDSTRLTIIQCLYEVGIEKKAEGTVGLNVNEITKRTSLSRPAVYLASQSAVDKLLHLNNELQLASKK